MDVVILVFCRTIKQNINGTYLLYRRPLSAGPLGQRAGRMEEAENRAAETADGQWHLLGQNIEGGSVGIQVPMVWLHRYCTHKELHLQGGIFFLAPVGGSNPAGP